jgi:hypothetical protein
MPDSLFINEHTVGIVHKSLSASVWRSCANKEGTHHRRREMDLRPILPGVIPRGSLSRLWSHEGGGSVLSHDPRCQNTSQQARDYRQHALCVDGFVYERKNGNRRKRTCSFRPKRIGQIRKKERHRQSVKAIATPKLLRRGGTALLAELFLAPRIQSSLEECHRLLYQKK